MTLEPAFDVFQAAHANGQTQLVWTRLVDDLETPVSAYLKLGQGRTHAFLFESVEGGAYRGRHSVITLEPDLIWRCRGDRAELAEGADIAAGRYTPQAGPALDSLRDLVASTRFELPRGSAPSATT